MNKDCTYNLPDREIQMLFDTIVRPDIVQAFTHNRSVECSMQTPFGNLQLCFKYFKTSNVKKIMLGSIVHDNNARVPEDKINMSMLDLRTRMVAKCELLINTLYLPDVCKLCGIKPAKGTKLKSCSKCGTVKYCSVDCQLKDWKSEHKKACGLIKH
jgi:hypothetical protein